MFWLKKCILWTKVARRISTFWTFNWLSEVIQIPHVTFETRSSFCITFAPPFCNTLAKTSAKLS